MNHTLVANNTTYGAGATGAGATPALLAAGAIGGFGFDTSDGVFKLITTANIANFKEITFYLGLGNGKVLQSVTHYLKGNCVASEHPYRAASQSVLVLSNFGVPENNEDCCYKSKPSGFLKIGEDVPNFMNYGNVYYADAGGVARTATKEEVRDAIFDQLSQKFAFTGEAEVEKNANPDDPTITITFSNTFSVNPINPSFKQYYVAADGFLEGLVSTWTHGDYGVGTAEDVVPKEHLDRIYRGNLYTAEASVYGIYNIPSQYRAETDYDGFYFHTVNGTLDKTGQKALTTTNVYTWLYAPEGSAASDTILALVEALNGVEAVGP